MSVVPLQQSIIGEDPIDSLVAAHRAGHGLARPFYTDPAVFERDMERLFRRHWHCLAHESVIPRAGDFEQFRLGDEQIILTRGADGTVHALLNVCRHRGAEVCTKPKGNAKFFVCPYHAWTYANDGSLRAARLMPKDFDRAAHGLKKLNVRVAEGLVFVSFAEVPLDFDPVAQSLRASCGQYGWADAKVAHRQTWLVGVSRRQLERLFKEKAGISPANAYRHVRLIHAKSLVTNSDASMLEIALEAGFENPSHFARTFKKFHGQTPSELRTSAVHA